MMVQWIHKWRNKRWIVFGAAMAIVYLLIGHDMGIKHRIGDDLQLGRFWGETAVYFDNHDHIWHNDGAAVMVMEFDGQAAESQVWEPLPMTDRMYEITYQESHTWFTPSTFVEMAELPEIQNGYWFFVDQDKSRNGTLRYGESALENLGQQEIFGTLTYRAPGGYALALYDVDTDTLYYFQRNL